MLYVAFFMFSSFWLVSLALDMGKLMVTKTELQKAADAAALAAASAVDPDTGELIPALARDRAYQFANANWALRDASERVVIDKNADVDFPGSKNRVKVTAHRTAATGNAMTTIFARALGITHVDVRASAVAEVGPVNPCHLTVPFAPIDIAGGFKMGCGHTYTLTWMPEPSGGNRFNAAGVSPHHGNPGHIRYKRPDVVIMDFGDDCNEGACADIHGGSALQDCYLQNGYGCCLEEGQRFDIESGHRLNSVRNSLEDRWDDDTDKSPNICYRDYTGNGKRVLICPIVSDPGWDDGSGGGHGHGSGNFGGGNNDYGFLGKARIKGFVSFFLTRRPGQGGNDVVTGQFIQYVVPGEPIKGKPGENVVYGTRLVE